MHAIIRRIRRPLLPPDPPQTASVVPCSEHLSPAGSRCVPAPASAPLATPPAPPKIENRSENGQKQSDSPTQPANSDAPPPKVDSAQNPSDPIPPAPLSPADPSGPASQLSTLNPQPPWSQQPNEPAADYLLFTAWLQTPAPRRFRSSAAALGCSVHRLRRLSARHDWKTRAAAFDNHRASLESLALDQLLRDEKSNWKDRAERFRLQEWLVYEEMLQAARATAAALRKRPGLASLRDITNLYDLAFKLGRLATGMPLDPPATPEPAAPSGYLDAQAALEKKYGSDDVVPAPAPSLDTPHSHSTK